MRKKEPIFKGRIAKLIDVKSLVTLTLTATFVYIIIAGVQVPETFKIVYTSIICFYFGTQTQKKE